MNEHVDQSREIHEMTENRRLFRELERSGDYVFHGSPTEDIRELETRQAYDWTGGVQKEDGLPSVVATPYADIAIFRALVYNDHTGFGVDDGTLHFEATQKALDDARGKTGFVYVLPKGNFRPKNGDEQEMDWRSMETQQPVQMIRVTTRDLPSGIKQSASKV